MYINVHVFTIRCSISTRRRRLYINTPDQARETASRFFAGRVPTAISIPLFGCLASLLPPLHFVVTFLSHPAPTTTFSYSFTLRVQIVHSSSIDTCVRIRAATRICVYKFNYMDMAVNVSRKSRKYTGDSPKP